MASLLRRAISLSSPKPRCFQFRYASSAADSAHNCCIIPVPCPTRKLESSSFPSAIRTDAINISKAVDFAVQRLQQESEEDNIFQEGDLSLKITERGVFESMYCYSNMDGSYYICADLDREYGCSFEYQGTWEPWQNYLQCSKDIFYSCTPQHLLMRERLGRHIQRILAKKGINVSEVLIWGYVIDKMRRAEKLAKKLAWMQNLKDFMHN